MVDLAKNYFFRITFLAGIALLRNKIFKVRKSTRSIKDNSSTKNVNAKKRWYPFQDNSRLHYVKLNS